MQQITPYDLPEQSLSQEYDKYTPEHQEVWATLFNQQMSALHKRAVNAFFEGLDYCKFSAKEIPRVEVINRQLLAATGWTVFVVPGIIANKPFFELLAEKKFPATTWIRSKSQLEYLEEPDMFHDVFGHLPLLSNKPFAMFLEGMSRIALKYIDNPEAVELITRLYWYTVEFGLIKSGDNFQIYGAGILSSIGESKFSLEDAKVPRRKFNVKDILRASFYKHDFQTQYFYISSFEELYDSLDELETAIDELLAGR